MNEMPLGTATGYASLLSGGLNQQEHLHKVSGIEGMNTFQTKPSCDYALFEENSDIFCVKSTDASNTPSYRYFAFQEISREEAMQKISPYLMKSEFDTLKTDIISAVRSEMQSFKEDILNGQQFVRTSKSNPIQNAGPIHSETK